MAPGTPLLSVERVAYTYNDTPMELRRGLYRTDTHHYRFDYGTPGRTVKIGELRRWRASGTGAFEVRRSLTEHLPTASTWALCKLGCTAT